MPVTCVHYTQPQDTGIQCAQSMQCILFGGVCIPPVPCTACTGQCAVLHALGCALYCMHWAVPCTACVSADLDPSRFWIPYDVTHCLGMSSSLKCRKVTYKMCVAHPRKWIGFLLASIVQFWLIWMARNCDFVSAV